MPTVLILDRDPARRERLVTLLQQIDAHLHIEAFLKPEPALSWLYWHSAELVLVDSHCPGLDPVGFIQRLRQLPGGADVPLLMLTPWADQAGRRQVLDAGATDLLATPIDALECHARCRNLLTQRRQQGIIRERARWLEQRVAEATSEVRVREHETLLRLAKAGEYRDEETGNHVIRMAKYSRLIAERLGLSEAECEAIELAAPMHDIGKIGIPDEILRKPGRLTHCEFAIMKTHTQIGYEILKDSPSQYLQLGAVIALNHHEKYNGTGYPNQLGRDDIPLVARIVTIADAYDALTSKRPYKRIWPSDEARAYLNHHRGKYFDPACLDAFNAQLDRISRVQSLFSDRPQRKSAGDS